jgi:hypothetical protein
MAAGEQFLLPPSMASFSINHPSEGHLLLLLLLLLLLILILLLITGMNIGVRLFSFDSPLFGWPNAAAALCHTSRN